ncbi:MAG TPA: FAD-binding oxidoreductase [Bacteroidales bacterium]|nr:FAD-binding oxidoreductase [Bacteroidales bacterium]HNS46067.1 FAD-binding oxidoreductase [Bacteroidales bacterium]
MLAHEQKVNRIVRQLQERKSPKPVSFRKKAVSHEVPRLRDKRHSDEKIDLSDLNAILHTDPQRNICMAEPGVTFADLVKATLKDGLVPAIVPELKTITIGGAVAGCSLESMSFKYGGFHDTCLEYEVITAKGEVLVCTPENENSLLFQMVHGTFGTLGIISRLTFRLIPAKPFVKVTYQKFHTLEEYTLAIWQHYKDQDVDFMDGIIHSPELYVLSLANFTGKAPYTHRYDWMRIYYQSTGKRKEDFLKTQDYFFRYDRGVTNVTPRSFPARLIFGRFMNSNRTLKLVHTFRWLIPSDQIPFTVDVFIPFSKAGLFMDWYREAVNHFPLWCVPYKLVRRYEWIATDFLHRTNDELFLDLAIYGMKQKGDKNYYRIIEEELMNIGGIKTLISGNYYTEAEFWEIWNKDHYDKVKSKTDPDNIFRDLYTKTCRTVMGEGP